MSSGICSLDCGFSAPLKISFLIQQKQPVSFPHCHPLPLSDTPLPSSPPHHSLPQSPFSSSLRCSLPPLLIEPSWLWWQVICSRTLSLSLCLSLSVTGEQVNHLKVRRHAWHFHLLKPSETIHLNTASDFHYRLLSSHPSFYSFFIILAGVKKGSTRESDLATALVLHTEFTHSAAQENYSLHPCRDSMCEIPEP